MSVESILPFLDSLRSIILIGSLISFVISLFATFISADIDDDFAVRACIVCLVSLAVLVLSGLGGTVFTTVAVFNFLSILAAFVVSCVCWGYQKTFNKVQAILLYANNVLFHDAEETPVASAPVEQPFSYKPSEPQSETPQETPSKAADVQQPPVKKPRGRRQTTTPEGKTRGPGRPRKPEGNKADTGTGAEKGTGNDNVTPLGAPKTGGRKRAASKTKKPSTKPKNASGPRKRPGDSSKR